MNASILAELVERARTDADFRTSAVTDLEGTLAANGYELSEEEMAAVRTFHAEAAKLSDQQLQEQLAGDVEGHAGG
jgi:hypothetical protein